MPQFPIVFRSLKTQSSHGKDCVLVLIPRLLLAMAIVFLERSHDCPFQIIGDHDGYSHQNHCFFVRVLPVQYPTKIAIVFQLIIPNLQSSL